MYSEYFLYKFISYRKIALNLSLEKADEYINALKILRSMGTDAVPRSCIRLYYAYYIALADDPKMFKNMKTLLRIDEAHRETFNVELKHIKEVGDSTFNFQ